jgi:predicted ATPase
MEGAAPPFGPFRELLADSAPEIARIMPGLRRMFPDLPQPLEMPADQQRQYRFTKYREFVERGAQRSPIVVLFDDLHWADESTLLLLEHFAQYLSELPALAIGTYRDVELEVDRPFARTLEQLTRQRHAHRIALRRRPEAEVADLLARLGGEAPPDKLAQAIYHETEGNPFFVEEVFRHLSEEGKLFGGRGRWRDDLDTGELDPCPRACVWSSAVVWSGSATNAGPCSPRRPSSVPDSTCACSRSWVKWRERRYSTHSKKPSAPG